MIESHDNFCHLLSIHNVNFLFTLMKRLRKAIETETLSEFLRYSLCLCRKFLNDLYIQEKTIPDWVDAALKLAKIDI
jgi:hypothetical protein